MMWNRILIQIFEQYLSLIYRFFNSVPSKYLESRISLWTVMTAVFRDPAPFQATLRAKNAKKENLTIIVLFTYESDTKRQSTRAAKYGNISISRSIVSIGNMISLMMVTNSIPEKPRRKTRLKRSLHMLSPNTPINNNLWDHVIYTSVNQYRQ